MAYNYGGYNYNRTVGNDEIFSHLRTPPPFRMDVDEIVEPRVNDADGYNNRGYYNHGYNNNYQQMYYNDHDYDGRRDYNRNDRNNRGNYVQEPIPYPMDQEELRQISVPIRLSSTLNVERVISTLWQNHALRCSIARNVLTVTGSVPSSEVSYGPNEFLNNVREVSGDTRACIVQR